MNIAIATLGSIAILTSIAPVVQAQTEDFGSANILYGLQERSIRTTSFSSQQPYSGNNYRSAEDRPVGIRIDQNLQLQIQPERENLPIGVYPADDNAKGNRLQLVYEFEEPAQVPPR